MKAYNSFGFKGYYPDLPPDMCPDGALVYPSKNFKIRDGVLEAIPGWSKLQSSALQGIPLLCYKHTKVDGTEILVVFTTTDIYYWDDTNTTFKFLTWRYNTGTVSTGGTGNRTVTLSGGTWNTSWDDTNTLYIGFNTNNIDSVSTWYEVDTVDSSTQITLAEDAPSVSGVNYVLRKTYNGALNKRWEAVSFYHASDDENLLIATNGDDYPIKWDGDTTGYFEDLGGNPPKAKHVYKLAGMLLFANISTVQSGGTGTATPYTVIWSDTADAETWDGTGASGYQELYNTEGEIQFIADFGDNIAIVKSDEIVIAFPTGDADTPIMFKSVVTGKGAICNAWCNIKGTVGFITEDDIVIFDGTQELKSIAQGKVRTSFFDGFDYNKKYLIHGTYAPRYNEWRIFIPKLDASYPNECWVYDIKTGEWYYEDKSATASGAYNYKISSTIDSLTGTIDSYTQPIDSFSEARAFDDVVFGDENGYVYIEDPSIKTGDGANVNAVAVTKDYVGDEIDNWCRFLETLIHYEGTDDAGDVTNVQISVDGGSNFSSVQQINNNESRRQRKILGWNHVGRTCRLQFSGRYFKIYGFKLIFEPQGLR